MRAFRHGASNAKENITIGTAHKTKRQIGVPEIVKYAESERLNAKSAQTGKQCAKKRGKNNCSEKTGCDKNQHTFLSNFT